MTVPTSIKHLFLAGLLGLAGVAAPAHAGGNWGIGEGSWPIVFLAIIGLGWHVVFQLYKRSAKVEGL